MQGLQNVDLHTAVQMLGCWALRVEVLNSKLRFRFAVATASFEFQVRNSKARGWESVCDFYKNKANFYTKTTRARTTKVATVGVRNGLR